MTIRLTRLRFENPVLTKELRTRMRGARAYWILFVYLLVLSLLLFFTYLAWWNQQQRGLGNDDVSFAVGRTFYLVLFCTQAVLVGLITPALTAGAITMEREQRTYELLSASLLPRRAIVVGKLLAAVGFIGLLITASLPLISICFLLGGVSPGEVLAAFGLLLLTALLYGAVGMACSTVSRNTSTATAATYGTILLLFFSTLPLSIMNAGRSLGAADLGVGLGAVNPVGSVLVGTLAERYFGVTLPAWLPALVLNGLLAVILIVVAIHRLGMPQADRSGLLRLLCAVFVGLLAFFGYGALLPEAGQGVLPFAPIRDRMAFAAVFTVFAPCALVPIFATANDLGPGPWSGLDPRRLGRGEAPSGMAYALLLVLLCAAILWVGAPSDLRPRVQTLAVLALCVTFCFGALALLFSALLKNRWGAFAVVALAMLAVFLMPMASLIGYQTGGRGGVSDNFLYLSPIPAAMQLAGGITEDVFWRQVPPLWGGRTPFSTVTPALYGLLGAAFLAGARAIHARRRKAATR